MIAYGTVDHDEAGSARARLLWLERDSGPFWWSARADVVAGIGTAKLWIIDPTDGKIFEASPAAARSFKIDEPRRSAST